MPEVYPERAACPVLEACPERVPEVCLEPAVFPVPEACPELVLEVYLEPAVFPVPEAYPEPAACRVRGHNPNRRRHHHPCHLFLFFQEAARFQAR